MAVLKQRYSLDHEEMKSSFIRSHAMKVHQSCEINSLILMAVHEDKVVGSVELVSTQPMCYHLQNLVVDQGHRRSGIATKLLRDVLAVANKGNEKSRSVEIHLDVDVANVAAMALYEKHGFKNANRPYMTHFFPFQRRQHMIRQIN